MEFFTADKYTSLPRTAAYERFLDDKNLKSFRTYLILAIIFFSISLLVTILDNFSWLSLVVITINVVFLLALRINYNKVLSTVNIRQFLFYYLIAQIVFGCLINFSHILSGNEDEVSGVQLSGNSEQLDDITADSTSTSDTTKTDTASIQATDPDRKGKDTVWQNDKGNMRVTVDLSQNYDSFAEWLMIVGIILIIFNFNRTDMNKLWGIGLILPIACELITYGTLEKDNYLAYGIFFLVFYIIAFYGEEKTRKKFNEQYDFYAKKNFESMRMKKELESAKEIQLSMLPENNSIINDIEIAGTSIPASEVGGDYFDYFQISDSKLGVFICDVSGHGVASGLMLSGIRSCMHLILEDDDDPRIVMEKLNRMVRKTQHRKMFVTAIFALIDTEKNECRLFNAGHLPPYKLSAASEDIFKIRKHGITLGAIENITIPNNDSEVIFDFNPGDKIVFYTDGLSEAMNPDRAEYGFERIENTLYRNTDKSPAELIDLLMDDVRLFTGGNEQIDDLTILIIGRK